MKSNQLRGLLLEEAVLFLLRQSGYQTILSKGADETLDSDTSGTLFVLGRGTRHQIDAIADYLVQPPFSNPARLLVEAKFYDTTLVGLTVIRNAVGVLHDVSQYFIPPPSGHASKRRYTYQYSVVSATGFSPRSQAYAYAHDIFLISLGASRFFKPLLDSIRSVARAIAGFAETHSATDLRLAFRGLLQPSAARDFPDDFEEIADQLAQLQRACSKVRFVLVAVSSGGFPVFLSPAGGLHIEQLESVTEVKIFRDGKGWLLALDSRESPLFSFDLPDQVAEMYAEGGELSPDRALDLKQEQLRELQALYVEGETRKILRFRLDRAWLQALRQTD